MRAEIASVIQSYGEPVELTTGGGTLFITASVQSPTYDPLINDLDMSGFIVYISPTVVPAPPKKFDRIVIRGKTYAIEENASVERLANVEVVYAVRVRG